MEPLLEGLLRSLGGSEANFLEVCFGRIPSGNLHTKATCKKSRPPSGNFRPNPPELPRSPSRSFSSHKAGWKILLLGTIWCSAESASEVLDIAHMAFEPLLSFCLWPCWFPAQANKEFFQERQRNDVATGLEEWPSPSQWQSQRCAALPCCHN